MAYATAASGASGIGGRKTQGGGGEGEGQKISEERRLETVGTPPPGKVNLHMYMYTYAFEGYFLIYFDGIKATKLSAGEGIFTAHEYVFKQLSVFRFCFSVSPKLPYDAG